MKSKLIINTNNIVSVTKSISDLQLGIPIIIHFDSKKFLVAITERVSEMVYAKLKSCFPQLSIVISNRRSNILFLKNDHLNVSCANLDFVNINRLAASLELKEMKKELISTESLQGIEDLVLKFINGIEVLPCFLIAEIENDFKADFDISSISTKDIEDYLKSEHEITEISEADLNLQGARGVIKVFRETFKKDHYAIIIPPKDPDKNTTPLVRIHSSCFTGDLLESLKCDCHSQLHKAIEIMSHKNGGVIVYLNQEGRGIGLTNKVRVYQAQNMGYDTVEANELIGLMDDGRSYAIAASILKLLDIQKIELLTNNSNKSNMLIKYGIQVPSVKSHQFFSEEIRDYYLTKAKKLKHNINIL